MVTTSYLDRLLDPLAEALTPKMAAALLELRADSGPGGPVASRARVQGQGPGDYRAAGGSLDQAAGVNRLPFFFCGTARFFSDQVVVPSRTGIK